MADLTLQDLLTGHDTNIRKKTAKASIPPEVVATALDRIANFVVQQVAGLRKNLPQTDFGGLFDVETDAETLDQTATLDIAFLQNALGTGGGGNTTPVAPTLDSNDGFNTLAATHSLGTSQILVSENGGAYVAYAGTIQVGDVSREQGYWKFKTKASAGRNESDVALSPQFTVAGAPSPEQAGTNLLQTVNYSDDTAWYKENLLPLTVGQPSWRGTNTAYLLRPTGGNPNGHNIHAQPLATFSDGEHEAVVCVQAKYAGLPYLRVLVARGDGQLHALVTFNVQNQSIASEQKGSAQPATSLGVPDWYEYPVRFTVGGGDPRTFRAFAFLDANDDASDYSGDGTVGMFIDRIAVIALT
jgi:hypothetical protein